MPTAEITLSTGQTLEVDFEGQFDEAAIRQQVESQLGLQAERQRVEAVPDAAIPVPALSQARSGAEAAAIAQVRGFLDGFGVRGNEVELPSRLGAFLASAGDTFAEVAGGVQRMFSSEEEAERLKLQGQENQRLMAPLREQHPVSSFAGSIAPTLAIPGAGTLRGAAALGAGLGGLSQSAESQGVGALAGAAGGALGNVVGRAAGRAVTPFAEKAGRVGDDVLKIAKDLGIRLTPAQRTGNRAAQLAEESMRSSPVGAGRFQRLDEANQAAINRAAARSIGEASEDLSEQVVDRAFKRLGARFEEVGKGVQVRADDEFRAALQAVDDEFFADTLQPAAQRVFEDARELLNSKALDGGKVAKIASKLGRVSARVRGNDRGSSEALMQTRQAVDDLLERHLGAEKLSNLREARLQYRNLVTMVQNRVIQDGNVNTKILANTINRLDPRGFLRGRQSDNPLYQLAKLTRAMPKLGDSGTASRLSVPLTTGGVAGLAAVGGSEGDLTNAALLGGSPLLFQFALASALAGGRSGAALSNQLVGRQASATLGKVGARIGAEGAENAQ